MGAQDPTSRHPDFQIFRGSTLQGHRYCSEIVLQLPQKFLLVLFFQFENPVKRSHFRGCHFETFLAARPCLHDNIPSTSKKLVIKESNVLVTSWRHWHCHVNNWFNSKYNLNISKQDLINLLGIVTKNQLSPIQQLLVRTDRRCSDGIPLGPLLASIFMSSIFYICHLLFVYSMSQYKTIRLRARVNSTSRQSTRRNYRSQKTKKKKMSSNAQKRTVLLCYIRFKRDARCALMRNC